jgi:hypothetical protein
MRLLHPQVRMPSPNVSVVGHELSYMPCTSWFQAIRACLRYLCPVQQHANDQAPSKLLVLVKRGQAKYFIGANDSCDTDPPGS